MTVIPVHICAQETVGSKEWEEIINPPLIKGAPVLKFEKSDIHVGQLSEDDAPTSYAFNFTNVSTQKITITKIVTSCGCTVAKADKNLLLPGAKGKIVLTFNPYQKAGTLENHAFVYTNISEKSPTARITLLGEVTPTSDQWTGFPCVMGTLRLKRNTVQFTDFRKTSKVVERMVCVNSGNKPLKLSALLIPGYAQLRTEPEVIPPGGQADIIISLDGRLVPETTKDVISFSIVLGGIDVRPSDRTIRAQISFRK